VQVSGNPTPLQGLLTRLEALSVPLERDLSEGSARLSYGAAHLMVTDGRPATLRATDRDSGLVVVDLADDYATVTDLAFAIQDGADPKIACDAQALLAAAGIAGPRLRYS